MRSPTRKNLLQARPAALAALLITLTIGYGLGRMLRSLVNAAIDD